MSIDIDKKKIIYNLFWKFMERMGNRLVQFIVQIILARLLLPKDFGIIVLIIIFINISNVFIQNGFSTALIQKKHVDDVDFSSIFYISLFLSILLYIILFISAPFIAKFYNEMQLVAVLRVLSIILIIGVFNSIQNSFLARNMLFKKLFFSSFIAIIISGIVGILFAYWGFGVWALVAQQILNQLLITITLWFTIKWRPKLLFSFKKIKVLFSFGWKLLVSSLIDTLDKNIRELIIGKLYSTSLIGIYNRGKQFPELIIGNINGTIQSVLFPTLASQQGNIKKVKDMVRRAILTSSFIVFPLMIGLAIIAKPLVIIVLTEKWLPSVPFIQIFCISYSLWPIHTANLQAINAIGRSDIFLKLEIIKKLIGWSILIISIPFGIYAIAFGLVLSGILSSFINAYPNSKLLGYSYKKQIIDIFPSLLLSLLMGALIYPIQFMNLNIWITLVMQICIGALLYIGMALLFKLECLQYILMTFKEIYKK